jgi:hypothetical protein
MVLSQKILLITSYSLLLGSDVCAQLDSTKANPRPTSGFFEVSESAKTLTRIDRIGYVCGASLAFSLFDYVGFNATKSSTTALSVYRVLQVATQSGITYFLYKECGLSSAISFNLIWWTWGDDIGYFGWAYAFNPKPPWEGRYHNGLQSYDISWASWTPIGLTRKKGSLIDKATLVIQAMFGFSISIAIL